MKPYAEMTKEELMDLRKSLRAQYREYQGKDLKLDMSRGKPCVEQLDLSMGMMDVLNSNSDLTCEDGTDFGAQRTIRRPLRLRQAGGFSGKACPI